MGMAVQGHHCQGQGTMPSCPTNLGLLLVQAGGWQAGHGVQWGQQAPSARPAVQGSRAWAHLIQPGSPSPEPPPSAGRDVTRERQLRTQSPGLPHSRAALLLTTPRGFGFSCGRRRRIWVRNGLQRHLNQFKPPLCPALLLVPWASCAAVGCAGNGPGESQPGERRRDREPSS